VYRWSPWCTLTERLIDFSVHHNPTLTGLA
jgi:hypothetical protein